MSLFSTWSLFLATMARLRDKWNTSNRLKELRTTRLRQLADTTWRTPHYRRVFQEDGLMPSDFVTEGVLAALSILEKEVAQAETSWELLAKPSKHLFSVRSAGSTGRPLQNWRSMLDQVQLSAV